MGVGENTRDRAGILAFIINAIYVCYGKFEKYSNYKEEKPRRLNSYRMERSIINTFWQSLSFLSPFLLLSIERFLLKTSQNLADPKS